MRLVAGMLLVVVCSLQAAAQPINPSQSLRTLIYSPQWSLIFHVAVYFLVFFGLMIRPLQEKFERGGTAVAVGLALMFSVALAAAGYCICYK